LFHYFGFTLLSLDILLFIWLFNMIKYSICLQTLIPVRINPSERAEMVTQVLFGELFTINEITGNWAKITILFDGYNGWIDKKLVFEISEGFFNKLKKNETAISHKIISPINNITQNKIIPLVAGSFLPFINELGKFKIENETYHYKHKTSTYLPTGENIARLAKQFENAPYLWGGRTILGIDCSGFTQIVYKIAGIALNRDASKQIEQGKPVSFIEETHSGDLAFFDNDEGQIIHVGIILNKNKIIHASGWVRIDSIDHQGIFNENSNKYSHKLRVIKRII